MHICRAIKGYKTKLCAYNDFNMAIIGDNLEEFERGVQKKLESGLSIISVSVYFFPSFLLLQ